MWEEQDNSIGKEFSFKNFKEAVDFVNEVAKLAEKANHHPDILIHEYNKVIITLSTHSEGKVTDKDHDLARQIEESLT